MNINKQKRQRHNLKKEIDSVLERMSQLSPDSTEYTNMAKNLDTLYSAKSKEKDQKIKWDTIAVIAGNLLGIVIIVGYEKANVITSKALGFVIKGRV